MLAFVKTIAQNLNVQENNDCVAMVQYSADPSVDFYLNSYQTREGIEDAIQNAWHKGGRARNTGKALQYVKDNVFTASSGSRLHLGAPQILVLLTGGRSSDEFRNAVANLKAIGVIVFVVGTKNADVLEIQSISQKPEYAVVATELSDLSGIEQLIISTTQSIYAPAITPASFGKTTGLMLHLYGPRKKKYWSLDSHIHES